MKNKRMLLGTLINYTTVIVQMLSTVIVTPYLIKIFGENDYGIYKIILSLIAYLLILNLGIGNSLIRFLSEFRAKGKDKSEEGLCLVSCSVIFNLIACFFAFIVGIVLFFLIPKAFSYSLSVIDLRLAKNIFVILFFSAIFSILTDLYSSYLFVYERFVFVKSVDLIRYLLRVILIFSLLNNKSSAYHLAFIDVAVSAVVFLSNLTYAILIEKLRINFLILFKSGLFPIKEYCSYAGLFFFNLIIEQLIWNTDSIIIGMRLNPTMVTIFSSGAIISAAFNSMTQIISSMVFPRIVMKFSTEKTQDNATVVMIKISRLQAFIAFYILGGYIILGKYFVTKIWLGDSFEQAWSTSLIVMVGTLFSSLMGSGHLILRAINKQVFFLVSEFIIFFSNVVATYFLVVPLGIKGAAYSTTVAYILGMIIFIIPYYIRTIGLDIKKYLKNILSIVIPMIILSLTLFGFTKVFAIDSFKSMILWGLLYSFLYGICCFLVSTKEEKNMIISFWKGWRK